MDQDDLPPHPEDSDTGLSGEIGRYFAIVLGIGFFLVVAGAVLFWVMRATGHSPW